MSSPTNFSKTLRRTTSLRSLGTIKEDQELLVNTQQGNRKQDDANLATEHDGNESMMITVAHFPGSLPAPKYHPFLDMTSKPSMSQDEYMGAMRMKYDVQRSVMAKNESVHLVEDDQITIVCRPEPASSGNHLTVKRSVLERSPALAQFFNSPAYLYGCGTKLVFHDDQKTCFQAAKEYLEKGPDLYTADELSDYATEHTSITGTYDLLFLVNVHKLAGKLGLRGLMDLALVILLQLESFVDSRACTNLAEVVFNENYHIDNAMKNWLLELVNNHFKQLMDSQEWARVLSKSSKDFKVMWAQMTLENLRPISNTDETATDEHKSREKGSAQSDKKPQGVETADDDTAENADENEPAPPYDRLRGTATATAKARKVLGINSDGVDLVPPKKPSGLSRASKSLRDLMRHP